MAQSIRTCQAIAVVASALCLTCACGIGFHPSAPPPPQAGSNIAVSQKPLVFKAHWDDKAGWDEISPPQVVTVGNRSSQAIEIKQIALDQHIPQPFTLRSSCGASIAPEESCVVVVTFVPQAATRSKALLRMKFSFDEEHLIYIVGETTKEH